MTQVKRHLALLLFVKSSANNMPITRVVIISRPLTLISFSRRGRWQVILRRFRSRRATSGFSAKLQTDRIVVIDLSVGLIADLGVCIFKLLCLENESIHNYEMLTSHVIVL